MENGSSSEIAQTLTITKTATHHNPAVNNAPHQQHVVLIN